MCSDDGDSLRDQQNTADRNPSVLELDEDDQICSGDGKSLSHDVTTST
jgi:hypothetical protein